MISLRIWFFSMHREIDIPSSGKFMNRLEEIIKAAEPLQIAQLIQVATGLNHILEKIVFDTSEGPRSRDSALLKRALL